MCFWWARWAQTVDQLTCALFHRTVFPDCGAAPRGLVFRSLYWVYYMGRFRLPCSWRNCAKRSLNSVQIKSFATDYSCCKDFPFESKSVLWPRNSSIVYVSTAGLLSIPQRCRAHGRLHQPMWEQPLMKLGTKNVKQLFWKIVQFCIISNMQLWWGSLEDVRVCWTFPHEEEQWYVWQSHDNDDSPFAEWKGDHGWFFLSGLKVQYKESTDHRHWATL